MRIRHPEHPAQDPAGELELFMARSGRLSARINRNGSLLHLHSAIKPEAEADYFSDIEFWGDLIVFLGTGLGYHIAPYCTGIGEKKRVLVVDYYQRCVSHCREPLLNNLPNEIIEISSATIDRDKIARECSVSARYIQVIKHPASYHANREFYDAVMESIRFKRTRAAEAETALLFSGSFFLEQELRNALASKGRKTALFRYNEFNGVLHFESALSKAVQEHRPRYILSVNMKGFDADGIVSAVAQRFGVPVIVWFVDDPHPIMLSQKKWINNHMFAFTWERSYIPWLSGKGFGAVNYLPLAADPSLFSALPAPATSVGLGFVGSSMGKAFLADLASRFLWNPSMEPLALEVARRLLLNRDIPVTHLMREACDALGMPVPFTDERNLTWFLSYIIHTASMLRRKELVSAGAVHGIETFGDPDGWKELIGDNIITHPDIDYRTGVPAAYSSIDINLNITSCQMPRAVNQRVFDVPLSNGFILNDDQPDLHELFASDEIAVYTSRQDLHEKIDFYRQHPGERVAITAKARSAIMSNHTYLHRLSVLEKILT
jgi:spore maturation protein CgeB